VSKPPHLSDSEWNVALRAGATDQEIGGKGTRANCIRFALELSDEHAAENFPQFENDQDKVSALNAD
jgi:hypothetical protein